MRNNLVKLYRIWVGGSGEVVSKIPYLELWRLLFGGVETFMQF